MISNENVQSHSLGTNTLMNKKERQKIKCDNQTNKTK